MKFKINVCFFDIIEGYSTKKIIPIIFDNIKGALSAKEIIQLHNEVVNYTYQNEAIRKINNLKKVEELSFEPEKESWFVSALESIEYDLMSLKDNAEIYNELVEGYNKDYLNFKEKSKIDYMDRSLSYLKINEKIIIAEWSSFSTILKDIEIVEINEEENIFICQKIEDMNYNKIFSVKTTLPIYMSVLA